MFIPFIHLKDSLWPYAFSVIWPIFPEHLSCPRNFKFWANAWEQNRHNPCFQRANCIVNKNAINTLTNNSSGLPPERVRSAASARTAMGSFFYCIAISKTRGNIDRSQIEMWGRGSRMHKRTQIDEKMLCSRTRNHGWQVRERGKRRK